MVIATVTFPLGSGSHSISTGCRISSGDEIATTHETTWMNLVTTHGQYRIFIIMLYGEDISDLKIGFFKFFFLFFFLLEALLEACFFTNKITI